MIRLLLRLLGLCLLAYAFIVLILDVTHTLADGKLQVTPAGEALSWLAPSGFAFAQEALARHLPWAINPLLSGLTRLPLWLGAGAAGWLSVRLGRKPAPKFGYLQR
ncbi:MAG TPA: hypothetical protein VFF88_06045 [Methylocella sp.]|nr:hypothetical protein [Methylocella sp.]